MLNSSRLFQQALKIIPGGVNSPVRAFKGVDAEPIFFKAGRKAYLIDVDDKHYIDYVNAWGSLILGHSCEKVIQSLIDVIPLGLSFGAPTELEIDLAKQITQLMPAIEKIRMVNSGTEATMTAIRLARGYTKKNKIIKFNGCYHGHSDSLLAKAGSGVLTLGLPSSPGIPKEISAHTLVAEFNDLENTANLFHAYKDDIAAVIVEPIAGNMGLVLPKLGFLAGLQNLCVENNALLIFDEVITGFRVALGGAQELYKIKPDLTTLGKVIGGGLSIGAVGGKDEIMAELAPVGPVYQAGTLSGNPLAMTAGIATLKEITTPDFFLNLNKKAQTLITGLMNMAKELAIPLSAAAVGGMFGFCFTEKQPLENYWDVQNASESLFKIFFKEMLKQGIYFAPSRFEVGFISSAHQDQDIAQTLAAAKIALEQCHRSLY